MSFRRKNSLKENPPDYSFGFESIGIYGDDCCRLGLVDNNEAYIIPMNFGYDMVGIYCRVSTASKTQVVSAGHQLFGLYLVEALHRNHTDREEATSSVMQMVR